MASPRSPHVSASLGLRLEVCTTTSDFFTWVLRIELQVFVFARACYLLSHLLSSLPLFSLKSPGPSQLLLPMELCAHCI